MQLDARQSCASGQNVIEEAKRPASASAGCARWPRWLSALAGFGSGERVIERLPRLHLLDDELLDALPVWGQVRCQRQALKKGAPRKENPLAGALHRERLEIRGLRQLFDFVDQYGVDSLLRLHGLLFGGGGRSCRDGGCRIRVAGAEPLVQFAVERLDAVIRVHAVPLPAADRGMGRRPPALAPSRTPLCRGYGERAEIRVRDAGSVRHLLPCSVASGAAGQPFDPGFPLAVHLRHVLVARPKDGGERRMHRLRRR